MHAKYNDFCIKINYDTYIKNINLCTSKAIANPNRYVFVEKNDWLQLDVNASRKPLLTIPIMVKHFKIAYHEPMS